jgi:hypothetical protein
MVVPKDNGAVSFDTLSLSEASLKHEEREFCLTFAYHYANGLKVDSGVRTHSFYAYSHKKVLERRRMCACSFIAFGLYCTSTAALGCFPTWLLVY